MQLTALFCPCAAHSEADKLEEAQASAQNDALFTGGLMGEEDSAAAMLQQARRRYATLAPVVIGSDCY